VGQRGYVYKTDVPYFGIKGDGGSYLGPGSVDTAQLVTGSLAKEDGARDFGIQHQFLNQINSGSDKLSWQSESSSSMISGTHLDAAAADKAQLLAGSLTEEGSPMISKWSAILIAALLPAPRGPRALILLCLGASSARGVCNNEATNYFPVNTSGMLSWYQHQTVSATSWLSTVGSLKMTVKAGTPVVAGTCPQQYLSGTQSDEVDFGNILGSGSFTLCSVTKYTGTNHNAMLVSSSTTYNWRHGAFNSQWVGSAYYNGGWVTETSYSPISQATYPIANGQATLPWIVLCAAKSATFTLAYVDNFRWVGNTVISIPGAAVTAQTPPNPPTIGINNYPGSPGSDFGLMELMSWSRILSYSEIADAMAYLNVVTQQTSGWAAAAATITPDCTNESVNLFSVNTSGMISWYQHQNIHMAVEAHGRRNPSGLALLDPSRFQ